MNLRAIKKGLRFFVLLCMVSLAFSGHVLAQNVTVSANNVPLKGVLKNITKQTGFEFAYSDALKVNDIKVNVNVKDQDINSFFNAFFPTIGISYKVVGKMVSLSTNIQKQTKQEEQPNAKVKIRGKVTDNEGEPLMGVYVAVLNTNGGTSTDFDGNYSIDVKIGQKLKYSFIGFKTEQKEVTKNISNLTNIVMTEDAIALEGAVVIGYGNTQKIKDVTGSISHMGNKDIKAAAMGANVSSMLQGKAAGVNVQIQSASPTSPVSVIIRGQSSLSGDNQPLWVIDGIPEYNAGVSGSVSNVLYSLNLNDVESIDILKDASSTAIYGSRAANGVIVVTTKSGKEGMKPTLEFSAKVGFQLMNMNGYDYFDAEQYKEFTRAAMRKEFYNIGKGDYFTRQYLDEQAFFNLNTSEFKKSMLKDLPNVYYDNDTPWMDEMTQTPIQQQYDLTLRGGTKDISYLASASYQDMNGIVRTGYSRMFSGRIRLEARISKALKFRVNASGSTRNSSDKDYMLDVLKKVRPDFPAYNEDGTLYTKDQYTENPYTTLANKVYSTGESIQGGAELEWTIIPGLIFTSRGSINYSNSESLSYMRRGSNFNTTGKRNWSRPKSDTKIWDNTLVYAKQFGKHDLSASGTVSMERFQKLQYKMSAANFPDDDVLNSFDDAADMGYMGENYYANSMLSQLARIQYKYDDRYLATFTVRHDGSSRFGPDSKWGWFPSGGIGWTISNEKFMKKGWVGRNINHLKLRASYGKSGSQNLGYYDWMTMVGSNKYNGNPGIYPSNIGNNGLKWEESYMTDLALEMEFWESRIRATLGYYMKDSEDLIYSQTLPSSSAFSEMNSNIAVTRSSGIEFSIDVDVVKNDRWQLSLNANGSNNKSKVKSFNNTLEVLYPRYSRIVAGGAIGEWWGYKTNNRLFGSAEEVTALKDRTETGGQIMYRNAQESDGDIYVQDLNGDGKITADDAAVLGSSMPKLFGGFGLQIYIGSSFSLGATFTYSLGNKRLWAMPMSDVGNTGNYNQSNKIAGMSAVYNSPYNASTLPNATPYGHGKNGSVYNGGVTFIPDYWLYDGSYVRLSTLNASYRFGKQYFGNSIVDNIEINFNAGNLFTLTKYPGFDPQGNFSSNTSLTSTPGVDNSTYPSARTFTLGIKFTFK
ncbi:MAG: SusC/RagA family TonB-linked outer membrane protein [Bacteroidales bacterium]